MGKFGVAFLGIFCAILAKIWVKMNILRVDLAFFHLDLFC